MGHDAARLSACGRRFCCIDIERLGPLSAVQRPCRGVFSKHGASQRSLGLWARFFVWGVTQAWLRRHCLDMSEVADSVEELWNKWGDDLLRYATVLVGPDDAGDVVDDTVVKLLSMRGSDLDRRGFERPYLFRMVLNQARMCQRSRTRRERREWKASALPDHVELLVDPTVRREVGRLSVMQRAVVYLTYWEDLAPAVVAAQLEVSEGTVKRHLARARSRLRKVLT